MWALALLWLPLCSSLQGVSLSKLMTSANWASLRAEQTVDFASIHAFFYNGTYNPHAGSTLASAWANNITDLSVYMHPCIPSSANTQDTNITCGTPLEHLTTIVASLALHNLHFVKHDSLATLLSANSPTPTPTLAPTAPPTTPTTDVLLLQRIFVDIEDESPARFMSAQKHVNVQYLADFANAAQELGIQVGVFSTRREWFNVMTDKTTPLSSEIVYFTSADNYTDINPFTDMPLWTPRYDQINSMDFFTPLAGWERVFCKQTSGGTTALRRIGDARVNQLYINGTHGDGAAFDAQVLEYVVL